MDTAEELTPGWPEQQALRRVIARRLRREATGHVSRRPQPAAEKAETRVLTAAHALLARLQVAGLDPLREQRQAAESVALWRTAQVLDHLHLLPPVPDALQTRLRAVQAVISRVAALRQQPKA